MGEHETEVKVVIPSSRHSSWQCFWSPGAFAHSALEKSQLIVLHGTVMMLFSLLLLVRISCVIILYGFFKVILISFCRDVNEAKAQLS